MDFMFTEAQKDLREKVRKFAEEKLSPLAPRVDESDEISPELVKLLAENGYLRLMVPKEYGGAGMVSCVNICIIREEFAKICTWADSIFTMQGLGTYPITLFGTEAQQQKFIPGIASGENLSAFALSEPEAGSDVANLKTTAVLDGDHYVLNGRKRWISRGPDASIFTVFAKTDPTLGHKGISAFIVERGTPGFDPGPAMKIIYANSLSEPVFENCRVPKENLFGEEGRGMNIALQNLNMFRTTVGATALGMAGRAYQEAVKHARRRTLFGQQLSDFQLTQAKIADMATELQAAKLMVYRAAILKDQDQHWRVIMQAASMAKLFATEMSARVIDQSVQIHGGSGIVKGVPVERLYRASRALRLYEGTSEIQRLTIARSVLREEA